MTKSTKVINKGGTLGGSYFITFIGAAVYFVQRADGFWAVIWALLKATVWPAIVLHQVLVLLKA